MLAERRPELAASVEMYDRMIMFELLHLLLYYNKINMYNYRLAVSILLFHLHPKPSPPFPVTVLLKTMSPMDVNLVWNQLDHLYPTTMRPFAMTTWHDLSPSPILLMAYGIPSCIFCQTCACPHTLSTELARRITTVATQLTAQPITAPPLQLQTRLKYDWLLFIYLCDVTSILLWAPLARSRNLRSEAENIKPFGGSIILRLFPVPI